VVIYKPQATNRSVAGKGGSHKESSLLPFDRLGIIYDSQPPAYAFFIAIRIRVNSFGSQVVIPILLT
jgi:hypothetical protein